MAGSLEFPLYERAAAQGVIGGASALIVAPTATGKSFIGREALRRASEAANGRTHVYLVPFRALAEEVYSSLAELLGPNVRLRIVTGDHRDPLRPGQADVLVATYESFIGLLRDPEFRPGLVVADEVHLVADDHRGPAVEGMFARLLASERATGVVALSAVVENADELANWLKIPLIVGELADRPVSLEVEPCLAADVDAALCELLAPCCGGEQALVFCSSRRAAEKVAREVAERVGDLIGEADRRSLEEKIVRYELVEQAEERHLELYRMGVAYHHAGLPKPMRKAVEEAFREHALRVVVGTTTLAAGVNLPAGIAVVRDVFRFDMLRGVMRHVLLPSGEVLNMVGRAARPHQVASGTGVVLLNIKFKGEPEAQQLLDDVVSGRGGRVASRLADSFEGLMRFVLEVVIERGEATREDLRKAFSYTLANQLEPEHIAFDRTFEEDMMEDLPAYRKVVAAKGTIYLADHWLTPDGVAGRVASGDHSYVVHVGLSGIDCDCPAARQFYRGRICKHQACAIHELLFASGIDDEARQRATYACGHLFSRTLDLGTRLTISLGIFEAWGLVERVPSGYRVTPAGEVAAASGLDLLLVHEAMQRIADCETAPYRQVAGWAVEDYFADDQDRTRWALSTNDWLEEVDIAKMKLPTRYRGDFERGLEDLAQVCTLYERTALALGRPAVAEAARKAAQALRYGVAPQLVPLASLGFAQLGRARARLLYERGVGGLRDLASCDPEELADARRMPAALIRAWRETAREVEGARGAALEEGGDVDGALDALIARFRLDRVALQ